MKDIKVPLLNIYLENSFKLNLIDAWIEWFFIICTALKMKFYRKDFLIKYKQI